MKCVLCNKNISGYMPDHLRNIHPIVYQGIPT